MLSAKISVSLNLLKDKSVMKMNKKNTEIQMSILKTPHKSPVKVTKMEEGYKDILIPSIPIIKPGELNKALKSIEHQ